MEVVGLFLVFGVLLVLRQSVILILLAATAYVHVVWGDGLIVYLVEDIWTAMATMFCWRSRCSLLLAH